jgi:hypothetical protein
MGGLSNSARRGGVMGGLSKFAKLGLAIAQAATKATRLTFIMIAPKLNCLKQTPTGLPARCAHRYKRHPVLFPLITGSDILLGESLNAEGRE